jgi:hypothetical protein
MKKNLNWLKVLAITAILTLLAAACAPGDIERIPVSGQGQPGGAQLQAGAEGMDAGFNPPPTQPICPTPTPIGGVVIVGGGETGGGEAVAGPAGSPEAVSGDVPIGTPDPDLLDQVNLSPDFGLGDQGGGGSSVGPGAGTESQVGEPIEMPEPAESSGPGESPEPTFGDLLNSVIGQVLGTSEPGGTSFNPMPSPTPCP